MKGSAARIRAEPLLPDLDGVSFAGLTPSLPRPPVSSKVPNLGEAVDQSVGEMCRRPAPPCQNPAPGWISLRSLTVSSISRRSSAFDFAAGSLAMTCSSRSASAANRRDRERSGGPTHTQTEWRPTTELASALDGEPSARQLCASNLLFHAFLCGSLRVSIETQREPETRTANGFLAPLAEGEGFEPSSELAPRNGFRDRRIRPLCHPSGSARVAASSG